MRLCIHIRDEMQHQQEKTMAAKFYHPLFSWDRSEIIFALVTIFIAIAGSIGIAKMMEKTHLAYLFGKGKMLR